MKEIKIGSMHKFNYPIEFVGYPNYTAHRGQQVRVIRELNSPEEYLGYPEGLEFPELMYEVKADDGWVGSAWQGELQ